MASSTFEAKLWASSKVSSDRSDTIERSVEGIHTSRMALGVLLSERRY